MPGGKPANTIIGIMGRLIVQENGCCLWVGQKNKGYGIVRYRGRRYLVHRLLYEQFVGPVPPGLELDHFYCQNRACANFAHLEPVTDRENAVRGLGWAGINHRKTHCPSGHEYTPDNTITTTDGGRRCLACTKEARKINHPGVFNGDKTHCANGHPYEGDNLYQTARGRYCRTCRKENHSRCRASRKTASNEQE